MWGFGLCLGAFVDCIVHLGSAPIEVGLRPFFYLGFLAALVLVAVSLGLKGSDALRCRPVIVPMVAAGAVCLVAGVAPLL